MRTDAKALLSSRGSLECRCCGSASLDKVLDLGSHPLPSEYGFSSEQDLDAFPLELRVCFRCGLGQIAEYVVPERIFHSTYPYLSSMSETWVRRSRDFAQEMTRLLSLDHDTIVLEIACNDGYLLNEFQKLGVTTIGVEPARNVADICESKGIETIRQFFGLALAAELKERGCCPRLIIVNNAYAHVPDMRDFTAGLSLLCSDETIITIENPSLAVLLSNNLFDTIYHEHYSYLSVHSVREAARLNDLQLIRVDRIPTHGGSNRYWLSRAGSADSSVAHFLAEEIDAGIFSHEEWRRFSMRSDGVIQGLRDWIIECHSAGRKMVAYGAAHKGNTFLNAVGEASKLFSYVVDASREKHGRFLPGSKLPVFPPEQLTMDPPDEILILPWNLASEIAAIARNLSPDSRIWIAQPRITELTN